MPELPEVEMTGLGIYPYGTGAEIEISPDGAFRKATDR